MNSSRKQILKAGCYSFKVEEMQVRPTLVGNDFGSTLHIKLALTENAMSLEGTPIRSDFRLTDRVLLMTTLRYSPAQTLASLMDCFLGRLSVKYSTDEFIGKLGMVRVAVIRDNNNVMVNKITEYQK